MNLLRYLVALLFLLSLLTAAAGCGDGKVSDAAEAEFLSQMLEEDAEDEDQ